MIPVTALILFLCQCALDGADANVSHSIGAAKSNKSDDAGIYRSCYQVSSLNENKAKNICRKQPSGVVKYPFTFPNNSAEADIYSNRNRL